MKTQKTNKTALITGASAGIGKELAMIHAEMGDNLVVIARSEEKLNLLKKELQNKYGVNVTVIAKDLSEPGAPKEIFDEVKNGRIEVDYLVNNAGFGSVGKFHEMSLERQLTMINLNVASLTALTHLFLPEFIKRGNGKILNVSSTASLMPGPLQAVYFATKAYVTNFSNALSEELAGTGVTITNLMPGATETEFGAVSGMEKTEMFKNAASARKVAQDGYYAMMNGKMDRVSGLTASQKLLTGLIPFMPKKLMLKTVRKMQEIKD